MARQIQNNIDQFFETVKNMQKSLECTICLQLMAEPTKTRCGHSFCKACIGKVLQKKNAFCPLCKKNLSRRNVSKDDHVEACITKFSTLVTAIQLDNMDILSHSKPRNTRESCDSFPANENDNASLCGPDVKVRTWLHNLPDDPNLIEDINLTSNNDNKLDAINEIRDNKDDNNRRSCRRKRIVNYVDEDTVTSQVNKDNDTKQFDEVIETDSAATNKLKYRKIHNRVREKICKIDASISVENNRSNSSSTIANDETHRILSVNDSNTSAIQSSSTDWTRIIEFGKETRRNKKGKMKKLNVSTEKNKDTPRIIENIILSSNEKYDVAKIAMDRNMNKEEKNRQKRDTIDKNLDLSGTNVIQMPSKISNEVNTHVHKDSTKNKDNSSTLSNNHSPTEIYIKDMIIDQVNEIIGFESFNKNSRASQNRCREESEIVIKHCGSLLSSSKRLTVSMPKKLNESICEYETIRDITTPVKNFGNLSPVEKQTTESEKNNSTLDKRTMSQSLQSPISKAKLSLKRKLGIDDKKTNSPLLNQVPLIDKLSIIEKDVDDRKSVDSPVSKDEKLFDPLTAIRRDLNLEIVGEDQVQTNRNMIFGDAFSKKKMNENVSRIICQNEKLFDHPAISKKSENIKTQRNRVKYFQMGSMSPLYDRQRNVKYFYSDMTRREQSMPAQVQITSVYNMQQSISKSEMNQYNVNMSYNLSISPDLFNKPQDTMSITVIENSVTRDISKKVELSTSSLPRKVSKSVIDHHLNQKRIVTIENVTEENTQSLHKTLHTNSSAIQQISRVHSGTSNSIKLLSPDKDSQLKFLTIDSPMSEHGESKCMNSARQQSELQKPIYTKENNFSKVKNSRFAASTSKAREPSIESSDKKRKRIRDTSNKELFDDDRNDLTNSSDSASDSGQCRIKCAGSSLDASKKHRSSSLNDQNIIEIISSDSEEQDRRTKKFKRILPNSNSNTESESTEHVAKNWKRRRTDDQSVQQNASITNTPKENCLSIRYLSEEKLASHKPIVVPITEKNLTIQESEMFESSSMFNSENLDYILQQSARCKENKISKKIAETSNDDIINRVLQIDRSWNNTNVCRSLNSVRNNETSREGKNSKEYLLQDNFDEIIANVELPQSNEDMIACTNQPTSRNLKSRLLAEQKTSNCLAMTDESCGAAQEISMLSASSTKDIFEHYSPKNLQRHATITAIENFGKENVTSHSRKKHDCIVDRREKENQRIIVTGDESNLTTDNLFDSLMNVTEHQIQLEKFEEELFSTPTNQNQKRTTKITSQEDLSQEEQHTPEKRKKDIQNKKVVIEMLFDEDDIVEKTPDRKLKNNGNNGKLLESRKNTSYLSPISKSRLSPTEQIPSTSKKRTISINGVSTPVNLSEIHPLYQSTPQSSITNKPNIHQQSDRRKLCFVCSGLTATQLVTVKNFATKCNAEYVNQFESSVTHVIVNTTGEKNAANSTLKFLQGIAYGKWIISYRWIEDCIEQGKLLAETPYEATTFTDGIFDNGPQRSRLRKKNLFEGFTFWCVGPYLNVSADQYQSLLLATGASVVDSLEALTEKKNMKIIVIHDGVHDDKKIEHWCRIAKAAPIIDGWIVDCIGNYKLFKLTPYIYGPSLQDLCAIGFPEELIGDEEYSYEEE